MSKKIEIIEGIFKQDSFCGIELDSYLSQLLENSEGYSSSQIANIVVLLLFNLGYRKEQISLLFESLADAVNAGDDKKIIELYYKEGVDENE